MFFLIFIPQFLSLFYLGFSLRSLIDMPFASEKPICVVLFASIIELIFLLCADVHDLEGIFDQIVLYFVIKGRIGCETGRVVNLDDIGVTLVVNHDIKTENVEAHVARVVFRLWKFILVAHQRQTWDYGFYYSIFDLFF